jgi:NAD(P)-dependent dehydrogenase (short-subunit alcohol dehydrogenase family)
MWGNLIADRIPSGGSPVDIQGKNALVLGGYGLVGMAVCRRLLEYQPARLVVASLRREEAEAGVAQLRADFPALAERIRPAWGDILLRAEWQDGEAGVHPRQIVLTDAAKRRRLVGDILDELNEDILTSSLLFQLVTGNAPAVDGPAQIIVDCVNTATAVAYQNVFQTARRLEDRIARNEPTDWPEEVERLLASLYVPQLVRHLQILYEAMLRAGTQAYIKVGTSGTGGMGFNIPYTHGEERPSRVLLSKSAVAGAQTLLTFLIGRTPGGPTIVKEIKPTAVIAWKDIGYGTIRRGGREVQLFDCPLSQAVRLDDPLARQAEGEFGRRTGDVLRSVFIDTGENGLFAAAEFTAITTLGQMEYVTPEEIADNVVTELRGGATGRDVIQALDGAVMGPSYRAGILRQAALARLRQLQAEHRDESIAFEILGPPRLSKLLYEAYLLQQECRTLTGVLERKPDDLGAALERRIAEQDRLRQRILSIGIGILLPDGQRLLRGPTLKSPEAEHGWIDLTTENMARWQSRIAGLRAFLGIAAAAPAGSGVDRVYPSAASWTADEAFDVGEIVGWLFIHEEKGRRGKA